MGFRRGCDSCMYGCYLPMKNPIWLCQRTNPERGIAVIHEEQMSTPCYFYREGESRFDVQGDVNSGPFIADMPPVDMDENRSVNVDKSQDIDAWRKWFRANGIDFDPTNFSTEQIESESKVDENDVIDVDYEVVKEE